MSLDAVPAMIVRERTQLAELTRPEDVADVEHRAAAIAELAKRAGLAVPIQNEATFFRAECLERLAVLVDEGEKPVGGRGKKTSPKPGQVSIPKQRVAEGRAIAKTGAIAKAREDSEKHPDRPVSMSDIIKQAKRSEREGTLRTATQARESEARENIASASTSPYELVAADLRDWRPEGVGSIITDPPYVGDSIPLYEALRDFALDVLPDGAPLVVMTWQAILPDVIEALRHEELSYRWCIAWRYANNENTVDHTRRVFDCWKPVLVYHKGSMPVDAPMMRDEISNSGTDKDFHEWGQSVSGFERLVRSFSQPGEIVCDPFLGGGTTAIAALSQARRFVGCDIDTAAIEITKGRLIQEGT